MGTSLTKDADKLICSIYKLYLERRKSGTSKENSKCFDSDFYKSVKLLSSWLPEDVRSTVEELKRADLVTMNIQGTIKLNDVGISYMENRFKNNLENISEFISKFLP